jgi:tetratricopeptide (TPR) repeat protein
VVSALSKVGRNDPCPCGSGKKYKKCCMAKDEERSREALSGVGEEIPPVPSDERVKPRQPQARAAEIENIFRRACNYLDKNELDRAARAFRSVLLLDPGHYKALTGLGRCLAEIGMREEARKCFEKALEINPDYAQARINLELRTKS